jgi:hypothetical protein
MVKKTEENKTYKPGPYICIVAGEDFAYFNKRQYRYGDRVVVQTQDLVDALMGAGNRFMPEEEFKKADADLVKKIRSASSNNKTVEDIVRSTEAEKQQMKDEYEAEIEKLKAQLAEKESAGQQ